MADVKFKGLFTYAGNRDLQPETQAGTYKLTPKYNDPYSADADRKLAKLLISDQAFREILRKAQGAANDQELLKLIDSTSRGYFDFFLESIDEVFDEKFQIMETLGDGYAVFGLGKKPRLINVAGSLLNSQENDWRLSFIKIFEKYISISRLAKFRNGSAKNVVTMVYDSVTVNGAILNLRTSLKAQNELYSPFAFTMLVTSSAAFNIEELSSLSTASQAPSGSSQALTQLYLDTPSKTVPGVSGDPNKATINQSEYKSESLKAKTKAAAG